MQFGNFNDAGSDETSLRSTHPFATLRVESFAVGAGLRISAIRDALVASVNPNPPLAGVPPYRAVTGEGYIGVRGLAGQAQGTGSIGVEGVNVGEGNGVVGNSPRRNGVQGTSSSGTASGVYGENLSGGGFGVAGRSNVPPAIFPLPQRVGAAVLGDNTAGGYAGVFNGMVRVNGYLNKSGGGFQIDNPIDPANSYLSHSFVESPDMMNVYNGNITTDADGNATVELPRYFEALNRDFCYQLTVVGQFAQAIVAEEVRDNRFSIKTDKPNVKVSWQVTGIRQDAWANAHRTEVEAEKPESQRGKYLCPAEHDQPATAGVYYVEPLATPAAEIDTNGTPDADVGPVETS
jgi:hypothetical protein